MRDLAVSSLTILKNQIGCMLLSEGQKVKKKVGNDKSRIIFCIFFVTVTLLKKQAVNYPVFEGTLVTGHFFVYHSNREMEQTKPKVMEKQKKIKRRKRKRNMPCLWRSLTKNQRKRRAI